MPDAPVIEPNTPAAPPPTPEVAPAPPTPAPDSAAPPPAAESEAPSTLPDNLIQLPAMQALIAGSPPAVSLNIKQMAKNPDFKLIAENKNALTSAGMGFYRSLSGDIGVIFNQFHIHAADIAAADKAGKLGLIAPNFESVNHAVGKSGITNPVLQRHSIPAGFKPPTLRAPPQFSPPMRAGGLPGPAPTAPPILPGAGPAPDIQRQLMAARIQNVSPGAPTSGAMPGAGRLLNQIMKPVV